MRAMRSSRVLLGSRGGNGRGGGEHCRGRRRPFHLCVCQCGCGDSGCLGGGKSLGDPRRRERRWRALGNLATSPQQQQRERVLAGEDAAGATASKGDVDVVDSTFVGLGAGADAATPHRPRIAAGAGPPGRNGQWLGGRDRRRPRRQRQHLLDLPTTRAHPRHRSKGVLHGFQNHRKPAHRELRLGGLASRWQIPVSSCGAAVNTTFNAPVWAASPNTS